MFGGWLRQGEHTKCAYTTSKEGSFGVTVHASARVSVYLFTDAELESFERGGSGVPLATSEHAAADHLLEVRDQTPLSKVFVVVQNRSAGRVEFRHARLSVRD